MLRAHTLGVPGIALAAAVTLSTSARHASADFATPPDHRFAPEPEPEPAPLPIVRSHENRSSVRLEVGPALLVPKTTPGLAAALNFGRHTVGARIAGAWLGAGTQDGISEYALELWVDFANGMPLHPLVGTGAALLRTEDHEQSATVGAAVLRGALEYELPLTDADARVGLSVTGLIPAIAADTKNPWVVAALTVGAGF